LRLKACLTDSLIRPPSPRSSPLPAEEAGAAGFDGPDPGTAVVVGAMGSDYRELLLRPGPSPSSSRHLLAVGTESSVASGRIAYHYGLHGARGVR